ncbi:MAG TPA: DICT sensory domain-containing protein [Pyrinomonadaceae bacterium]|nr:DICT sensory domain-containing protein [Pyrinomonadaceae bacterium]
MKDFSMFDCALKAAGASLADLGDLSQLSRRDFDARETFAFSAPVPCLEYASLLIENGLLLRTHRGGRVYAGFERLSLMEPVIDRYLRIADISEHLNVFGVADWSPPRHPRLRVVALRCEARLAREWFVIADSPLMHVALVGVDATGACGATAHEARTFRALKTSDPALVSRLTDAAETLIDASLNDEL